MTENGVSVDILLRKKMSDLLCQNVAIRSQMRFLVKKLNNLSTQFNQEAVPSTTLNEQINLYRYLLKDFQEAIRRHNELCEHIEMLHDVTSSEEISIEKKGIEQQLNDIIWLAYEAVYYGLHEEELNKCASDIIEAVNRICKLMDEHMAKEESILR